MQPKLIVEQKLTPFVNRYEIFSANQDGTKGDLLAFAEQKRFAIREKLTFFADATKQKTVFTMRAEKVMDVHGRYLIEDAKGTHLGSLKKEFKKSLLVSSWQILDIQDKTLLKVSESSMLLAILRRTIGFVPIIGEIVDTLMSFLLKYHFNFNDAKTGELSGLYRKTTRLRDHYCLEMSDEIYNQNDWRVLGAMAVGLDALQSR